MLNGDVLKKSQLVRLVQRPGESVRYLSSSNFSLCEAVTADMQYDTDSLFRFFEKDSKPETAESEAVQKADEASDEVEKSRISMESSSLCALICHRKEVKRRNIYTAGSQGETNKDTA